MCDDASCCYCRCALEAIVRRAARDFFCSPLLSSSLSFSAHRTRENSYCMEIIVRADFFALSCKGIENDRTKKRKENPHSYFSFGRTITPKIEFSICPSPSLFRRL